MFGSRVRYGISYKTDQPGFTIYTRKYFHNFKVAIDSGNYEGTIGANLGSMNAYVIAREDLIRIVDFIDFSVIQSWHVSKSEKDTQILFLNVSHDQRRIGVVIGRYGIIDEKEATEIIIFKRNRKGAFKTEAIKQLNYRDTCPNFSFNKFNTNEVLFFSIDEVYAINFKE